MPTEAYYLSENDLKILKEVVSKVGHLTTRPQAGDVADQIPKAPDVYVVRTPSGGIPALTEEAGTGSGFNNDEPGSADCRVYQLVPDGATYRLFKAGAGDLNVEVHNLSATAVAGDSWVLAAKDKFGKWWAIPTAVTEEAGTGGGGEAGNCDCKWLAGLRTTTCVTLTRGTDPTGACDCGDPAVNLVLRYSPNNWGPHDGGVVEVCGVDYSPRFGFDEQSRPYLYLEEIPGSTEVYYGLLVCCSGTSATFAFGRGICTGDGTDTGCEDVLLLTVTCTDCCPEEGWYCIDNGAGCPGIVVELVGNESCDPSITICAGPFPTEAEAEEICLGSFFGVPCAGSGDLPATLQVHFSGATGDPTWLALEGATIEITYRTDVDPCGGGVGYWWGEQLISGCYYSVSIYCCGSAEEMIVGITALGSPNTPAPYGGSSVSFTNPPFTLTTTLNGNFFGACFGAGTVTITISTS